MRSPALAIAWAVWRKNRFGNLLVLAAIPLCALLYRAMALALPNAAGSNFLRELPLTYLPLTGSLAWVFVVFSITETDSKRGFSGLPARMFTLPISTGYLVTCLMACGVMAVGVVYFAWAKFVFAPVGVELKLGWPLASLAAAMTLFQAVVWGLPSFPWIRALLIGVGGFAMLPLMTLPLIGVEKWQSIEPKFTLLAIALVPVAHVAALFGATGERCGGWQPWLSVRRAWWRLLDAMPRRRQPFASPAQAIAWMEWRRKGFVLVGGLAVAATSALCLFPVASLLDTTGAVPATAFVSTMVFPLIVAAFGGATLAKFDWPNHVELSAFYAAKPITTGDLVVIKLKVAARATLFGWALAVPCVLALASWPRWRELWLLDNLFARLAQLFPADGRITWLIAAMGALTMLALTWQSMVASLSVCLIGRERVIMLRSVAGAACFIFVITMGAWLYHLPLALARVGPWLYAVLATLAAWKIHATVRSFAEARRRDLLAASGTAPLLAIWFALGGCLVVLALLLGLNTPTPKALLALAVVWLWPGGEMAQCVVNLADNRHR